MLSINGTTNYSTARIDGVIFTGSDAEIQQIKEDITGITYNDVTDTTNITNNVAISKDLDVTGNLAVGGDIDITGVLDVTQLNVGANANAVAQFASISVGDNLGKIQVSNYSTNRASLVLENKNGTTQGITIQGPSATSETFNVAFTKTPAQNLFSASRTTFTINTGELFTQKINTPLIVQPDYNFATPNEMTNITMYDDSNLVQSGTGVIRQTGTQENYLKSTNITQTKTDVALLGYETDEFINKDAALRRYYPFDNTLGTGARFNNFNKYFVDGTYPASSMTNTGTLTFSSQIGQIGLNSIQYTSGRYFFNYFGNPDFLYDCNFMSFGGWVKATTSATSSRLFFINVSGTSAFIILDVDVGGSMYLAGDTTTFNTVSVATGTNAIWYHVFVVIDGTSQKVYRNGTLISTTTRTATFTGTSEATFGFGRDTSVMGTSNVDDLRLYSRSLTNAEVLAVYNYRGALREPWAVKMNGTVMLGDRIDAEYATRSFNVRSQDGIISIGRYSNAQPGFELLNFNPDTGVQRSNVLFLGGAAAEYATMLMRTGGDVFVYYVYRDNFDCQVTMRIRGAWTQIDGYLRQPLSSGTNEMAGITMYQNQSLSQTGIGVITQTNTANPTPITGINANTFSYYGTWVASGSSVNTYSGTCDYYMAFDNNSATFWPCAQSRYSNGEYVGAVSTTITGVGAVLGEWIQIQSPYAFALTQYTITQRSALTGVRMPRVFYIVGSTDGSTWNVVDSRSYANNTTGLTTMTNTVSGSGTYNYYRLVANAVYQGTNGNYVEMVEWRMTGTVGGTNELKSTNITGTLAITGYSDVKAALDTALSSSVTGNSFVVNTQSAPCPTAGITNQYNNGSYAQAYFSDTTASSINFVVDIQQVLSTTPTTSNVSDFIIVEVDVCWDGVLGTGFPSANHGEAHFLAKVFTRRIDGNSVWGVYQSGISANTLNVYTNLPNYDSYTIANAFYGRQYWCYNQSGTTLNVGGTNKTCVFILPNPMGTGGRYTCCGSIRVLSAGAVMTNAQSVANTGVKVYCNSS